MKVTDKRAAYDITRPDYQLKKSISDEQLTADDLSSNDDHYTEQDFVRQKVKQVNNWYEVNSDNIARFREDMQFLYGDQWSPDLRSVRTQKKKPVLTFNYLISQAEMLIGEEIQNEHDPLVMATMPNIPQHEVDLRADITRQTFYDNNMSRIKQYVMQYMVGGGWDVIEVGYDYKDEKAFQKKITLEAGSDPISYFFDPYSLKPDKSDGDYCGKIIKLTDEQYDMYFPDATSRQSFGVQYYDDDDSYVDDRRKIKVAYMFVKEPYPETIVLLSTGESMEKSKAEEMLKEQDKLIRKLVDVEKRGATVPMQFKQKIEIVAERSSICHRIMHYVMNGAEVLHKSEWPAKSLPYVFVPYREVFVNGEKRIISYHRYAQDAQRYVNYLASEAADTMMTSHHKNWIVPVNTLDGDFRELWLSPQNTSPIAPYKPGPNGEKPEYVPPPKISTDFNDQFERATNDIQNILGRFEANRGEQGNETSGVAINNRAQYGNLATTLPFRNLDLAIEQVANIIIELIPAVYDLEATISGRTKDGKTRQYSVNNKSNDPYYDMSLTDFKVTIESGASFAAQKQFALQMLTQMTQGNPQLLSLLGDLIAENLPLENMSDIVERVRMMMLGYPIPQILAKETGMQPAPQQGPNPQQVEMQMKQQELQLKQQGQQQDFQLRQQQEQNESMKIAVQAQQLQNDAIDKHGKTVAEMSKIHASMANEKLKSQTELTRAAMDNHVDIMKHVMVMSDCSSPGTS